MTEQRSISGLTFTLQQVSFYLSRERVWQWRERGPEWQWGRVGAGGWRWRWPWYGGGPSQPSGACPPV